MIWIRGIHAHTYFKLFPKDEFCLSYAVYNSTEVSYADPGSALPKYSHKHSSFDYCQFRYAAILQKK